MMSIYLSFAERMFFLAVQCPEYKALGGFELGKMML